MDFAKIEHQWALRVNAEYCSASITAELLHWLIALGVSPDTISRCHRIVADELLHAELSRNVFTRVRGNLAPVASFWRGTRQKLS